ncbi:unnamed protein product [Miscanthus lutarioriparius]|uniref:Uncharacterized protein n=1 Tax=Miscanthus lutarioriparius TaxID=422564 RepID=A0A811RW98_9POAL|nr:unnamed protein product [Miscanthus lutarioriparius]
MPLHILALNPLIHTVVIAAAPISSPLSSHLCEDATPQLYIDTPAFDPSRCIASMSDGSKSRRDRSIPFAISLSVVHESAATPNALSRSSGHLHVNRPHRLSFRIRTLACCVADGPDFVMRMWMRSSCVVRTGLQRLATLYQGFAQAVQRTYHS